MVIDQKFRNVLRVDNEISHLSTKHQLRSIPNDFLIQSSNFFKTATKVLIIQNDFIEDVVKFDLNDLKANFLCQPSNPLVVGKQGLEAVVFVQTMQILKNNKCELG